MRNRAGSIVLGTLPFGSIVPETESRSIIDAAFEGGIRTFDVSHLYGAGKAMSILGNALRGAEGAQIWCSVGLEQVSDANGVFAVRLVPLSEIEVVRSAERALAQLGIEKLNVLNIHGFDEVTPLEETLSGLRSLKDKGLVDEVSFSNLSGSQAMVIMEQDQEGLVDMVQLHGNALERRLINSAGEVFRKRGRNVAYFRPFARGLLTREYSRANPRPESSRSVRGWRLDSYLTQAFLSELEKMQEALRIAEVDPGHFALSWLLEEGPGDFAVIGVREIHQLTAPLSWIANAEASVSRSWLETLVGGRLQRMANALPLDHFER